MKRIIGVIHPFDFKQKIYVFDDNDVKMEIAVPLSDFALAIVRAADQEGIVEVSIHAQSQFALKAKKDIEAKEIEYYDANKLNITIE